MNIISAKKQEPFKDSEQKEFDWGNWFYHCGRAKKVIKGAGSQLKRLLTAGSCCSITFRAGGTLGGGVTEFKVGSSERKGPSMN